jgi:hypothetical protein
MCECGCTSNDLRYWFPAPGKQVYLLTLSKWCVDCDGPSGVSIELIDKSHFMFRDRADYLDGELKFADWSDSKGVAIVTGMRQHEFVKALTPHLVGVSAEDMGDDGVIDEVGAEVLLEEAYQDSQLKPRIVQPAKERGPK